MRSPSAENSFSEWLGRVDAFKSLWVRTTNDLKYLGLDGGHSYLDRRRDESEEKSENLFRSGNL